MEGGTEDNDTISDSGSSPGIVEVTKFENVTEAGGTATVAATAADNAQQEATAGADNEGHDGALELDATDTEESEGEDAISSASASEKEHNTSSEGGSTSSRRAARKCSRKKQERTSSRSNKFKGTLSESLDDVDEGDQETDAHSNADSAPRRRVRIGNLTSTNESPKSSGEQKSPAVRHSTPRRRIKTKPPVYDVSSDSESDLGSDAEDDKEEKLKIERIIASRSETIARWKEICAKMNTSEIENGSRWFQDDDGSNDEDEEQRFLVKWSDLGYLHCSWETERDLMSQLERPKPYFSTFNRKNIDGLIFDEDERGDGEFFDENMIQIERILGITEPPKLPEESVKRRLDMDGAEESSKSKFGIILDRKDPHYEDGTGRQFLIKWGNSPYSDCTYEFERDLILNDVEYADHVQKFIARSKKPRKEEVKNAIKRREEESRRLYKVFGDKAIVTARSRESNVKEYQKKLAEHEFGNGGKLRDYQAEGVSWLISNYVNKRSSILADEMGLGKTVQVASFVNLLSTESSVRGPFLVVAPLSTIPHWLREFSAWTDLNTVVYHGSAEDRVVIREYEMAFEGDRPQNLSSKSNYLRRCLPNKKRGAKAAEKWQRTWMAQVVITTPEMLVCEDFTELTAVEWEVLIVDEAHRMKNQESKVASNIRDSRFTFAHKVLMTGTPIQNNMNELWTILHLVDPEHFDDVNDFLSLFGDMKKKEVIDELHNKIRPYMLRRLKEDVETSVPPKEETVIEVELTGLQKQYYRALYEKNVQFLHKGRTRSLDKPSLSNLGMQLRKCCNHPFLLNGVEDEMKKTDGSSAAEGDFLVKASGKLVLLDKLLPKLKEDGHRVLVFSQFKIMLDILEDYFRHREMKYERIDGSITGRRRQMAIDRFQAEETVGKENPFVMMLSTRAGGVGINLTAADTCIIFDSDWNPQNDLQAQSRCHRIGQTKSVKVYRLLARKTFEMKMFHMSSLKMGLDQAVLQGLESGSFGGESAMTKDEVENLLRHGAYDMFNEEKAGSSEKESSLFEAQGIDDILARRATTVVYENTGSKSNAVGSTFSKASFKAVNDNAREGGIDDIDIDDPDFWTKVVGEVKVADPVADLSGKKRKRNKTRYSEYFGDAAAAATHDSDSSADVDDSDEASDEDDAHVHGPVDLAELTIQSGQKPRKQSAVSASTWVNANPTSKKQKKGPPRSRQEGPSKQFVPVRGIEILDEDRSSVQVFQSGPKILVLCAFKGLLGGDEIIGVNGNNLQGCADKNFVESFIRTSNLGQPITIDVLRPIMMNGTPVWGNGRRSSAPWAGPSAAATSTRTQHGAPTTKPPAAHGSIPRYSNATEVASPPIRGPANPDDISVIAVTICRDSKHPTFGISVASNMGKHLVHGLSKGGAAAADGTLQAGDELMVVNGRLAVGVEWRAVLMEIHSTKLGQPLQLRVLRRPIRKSPVVGGEIRQREGTVVRGILVHRDSNTKAFGIDMQWKRNSVAIVSQIRNGTPAAQEDVLKVDDEILSVNGKQVTGLGWTFSCIMNEMKATKHGEALVLDVFRPQVQPKVPKELSAEATVSKTAANANSQRKAGPVPSSKPHEEKSSSNLVRSIQGKVMRTIAIPRRGATCFGMHLGYESELVFVHQIRSGSPVAQEGTIQIGDFLLSVNGRSVTISGLNDVTAAIKATEPDENLILDILRPTEMSFSADHNESITTILKGIAIERKSDETAFGVILQTSEDRDEEKGGEDKRFCQKVYVNGVVPGGAAEREGSVRLLDVILSVNGIDLTVGRYTFEDVLEIVRSTKVGQPLVLDVMRPPAKNAPPKITEKDDLAGAMKRASVQNRDLFRASSQQIATKPPPAPTVVPASAAAATGSAALPSHQESRSTETPSAVPPPPVASFPLDRKVNYGSKARVLPDGSVVPSNPPKWDKMKGHFARPSGRPRDGMRWDGARGLWIPEKLSAEKRKAPPIEASAKKPKAGENPLSHKRKLQHEAKVERSAEKGKKEGKRNSEVDREAASAAAGSPPPTGTTSDEIIATGIDLGSAHKSAPHGSGKSSGKKARRASCLVDKCRLVPQHGTEGMCQRHWTEQVQETATSNGKSYVGSRVAKKFDNEIYYGTLSSYEKHFEEKEEENIFWHVDYDDGDAEDYDISDLCEALLLYNRVNKSDTKFESH